jgi:allophanate hydrolase
VLLLPPAPTTYTISEVVGDPARLNSNLGYYTNFVNLLDLSAIAVPAGFRPNGLPFGVSLIAPAFTDLSLLHLGDRLHRTLNQPLGGLATALSATPALSPMNPPSGCTFLAVVGAHLTGQPLNSQLVSRGARLVQTTQTSPCYRLYALANSEPPKPGLIRDPSCIGPGIEVEVWAIPTRNLGSFVAAIPAPLGIGSLELKDGTRVTGFICEPYAAESAQEITHLGGWRAYLKTLAQ